jgi:hypothetical protein
MTLILMPSLVLQNVIHAMCHKHDCYIECHYALCHYAECRFAQMTLSTMPLNTIAGCHFAERH